MIADINQLTSYLPSLIEDYLKEKDASLVNEEQEIMIEDITELQALVKAVRVRFVACLINGFLVESYDGVADVEIEQETIKAAQLLEWTKI